MTSEAELEASGLLDGLHGDARSQRIEVISWLLGRGFTVEQISNNISPVLVTANRVLGDDGTFVSARELCEQTGIELELLQNLQRAVGLPRIEDPDAAVLPRADGESVARAQVFMELGIDENEMIAVTRVLAEGLADAAAVMRQAALVAILRPGATELELAQAAEALAQKILPLLGPMVEDLLLFELRHGFETEAVNAAERASGTLPGAREISVAFADLVGFTQLGEALPPEDLENVASRLVDLTRNLVEPPVRFIKAIGDAVMLVSSDPAALLMTLLALIDAAAAEDDFPRLRVGMAFGEAVNRAGDWFGSPVNVASRVTGLARPGTVLVEESTRDALTDAEGIAWSYAGARRLRGVRGEVRLFRARRAENEQ